MSATAATFLFIRLSECQSFASASSHFLFLAFVASATPALSCSDIPEVLDTGIILIAMDAATIKDTKANDNITRIKSVNDYNQKLQLLSMSGFQQ